MVQRIRKLPTKKSPETDESGPQTTTNMEKTRL